MEDKEREELEEKFLITCKKCNSVAGVDYWTGSHGVTGHLNIACQQCKNEIYLC